MSKLFEDMQESNEVQIEKVAQEMIRKDEHIKVKTRIPAPVETSSLRALAFMLKNSSLEEEGALIDWWVDMFELYMVSYQGKSREEIVKMVTALLELRLHDEGGKMDKAMGGKK